MPASHKSAAVLVTIPLSHFCEKARWALDRTGLTYKEKPHVPLLHLLSTLAKRGRTVPLLIHESHGFTDSTAILQHADAVSGGGILYPRDQSLRLAVEAITARFDTELGEHTRRWAYAYLLEDPKLLRQLWSRGAPRHEATLLPVTVPITRRLVRKVYRITSESAQRSLHRIQGVFRDVDERLRDGRRFLIGEQFTAADLTFAALAAPVLFPLECRAVLPSLTQVPAAMREEIGRLRATQAGQFALRVYAQERGTGSIW